MGAIVWETDFIQALETAKNSSRLLFVAFSSAGCKACAEMERTTFTEENVQDYLNDHFVSVKYTSSKNPEKFLRFRVTETPTYIVLDLNGKEVKRIIGFRSSDDLIKELESAEPVS